MAFMGRPRDPNGERPLLRERMTSRFAVTVNALSSR